VLYRVFPFRPAVGLIEEGGALHVPRERQGAGRHDNPDHYGALYVSRTALSAVAERIQGFRGRELGAEDLVRADGRRLALAWIDDGELDDLIDLDDPEELARRGVRPSGVATRARAITQPMALAIHREGHSGLAWWSTLEASWENVTLFAERATPLLRVGTPPEPLTVRSEAVRDAAAALGISLRT
jgi:RES domain